MKKKTIATILVVALIAVIAIPTAFAEPGKDPFGGLWSAFKEQKQVINEERQEIRAQNQEATAQFREDMQPIKEQASTLHQQMKELNQKIQDAIDAGDKDLVVTLQAQRDELQAQMQALKAQKQPIMEARKAEKEATMQQRKALRQKKQALCDAAQAVRQSPEYQALMKTLKDAQSKIQQAQATLRAAIKVGDMPATQAAQAQIDELKTIIKTTRQALTDLVSAAVPTPAPQV